MLIGVKFCGGCNETYNRSSALNIIKKNLPQHTFEPMQLNKEYEVVLVICGCLSSCVELSYMPIGAKIYFISHSEKIEKVISILKLH